MAERRKSRFDEMFSGLSEKIEESERRKESSTIYKSSSPSAKDRRDFANILQFSDDEDDEDSQDNKFIKLSTMQVSRDEFDRDVMDTMNRLRDERNSKFDFDFNIQRDSTYKADYSKENDDQLNQVLGEISISSDDEDSDDDNKMNKLNTDINLGKLESQLSDKYEGYELIDIVENNEIKEITSLTADKTSCVTFSTSSKFDIPNEEKKLLEYIPLDKISQRIYSSLREDSDGIPT